jgi:hypothetical protein
MTSPTHALNKRRHDAAKQRSRLTGYMSDQKDSSEDTPEPDTSPRQETPSLLDPAANPYLALVVPEADRQRLRERWADPASWVPAYLLTLAQTGEVGTACDMADVPYAAVYRLRMTDLAFAHAHEAARSEATERVLEARAWRMTDPDDPNYDRRTAAFMLSFLLKGHNRQRYLPERLLGSGGNVYVVQIGDSQRVVESSSDGTIDLAQFTDAELEEIAHSGGYKVLPAPEETVKEVRQDRKKRPAKA